MYTNAVHGWCWCFRMWHCTEWFHLQGCPSMHSDNALVFCYLLACRGIMKLYTPHSFPMSFSEGLVRIEFLCNQRGSFREQTCKRPLFTFSLMCQNNQWNQRGIYWQYKFQDRRQVENINSGWAAYRKLERVPAGVSTWRTEKRLDHRVE